MGCSDIDVFKKSIKATFSRKLNAYDAYEISLFEANGTSKISAMDPIEHLNDKKMPLIAFVEPDEAAISITRHQDYKHSKAGIATRAKMVHDISDLIIRRKCFSPDI